MKPKWRYCPECGCDEIVNENLVKDGYRECKACGQEWWVDINYTDTVKTVLQNLKLNSMKPSPFKASHFIEIYGAKHDREECHTTNNSSSINAIDRLDHYLQSTASTNNLQTIAVFRIKFKNQ